MRHSILVRRGCLSMQWWTRGIIGLWCTTILICRQCIWRLKILLLVCGSVFGPIIWGHSGPLCHALSLLLSMLSLWTSILHCHSPGIDTVARRLRYNYSWLRLILVVVSTVATPGEWQCKISTGGVRRLAVANGPNIFQMLLVVYYWTITLSRWHSTLVFFSPI